MANEAAKMNERAWPRPGTGIMPIAVVAVEQSFPKEERVVDDPLAFRMLPPGARLFVRLMRIGWLRDWIIGMSEKSEPGIWGDFLCRKRYIDDKLEDVCGRIDAVVNLGAGFDTRAYRLSAISHLPVWEVDQQTNIVAKEERLNEIFGKVPSRVRLVVIDFDTEDLAAALSSNGYLSAGRTFFVWEGVTQYLTEEGVRKTFDFLAQAPGRQLPRNVLRAEGFSRWKESLRLESRRQAICRRQSLAFWHGTGGRAGLSQRVRVGPGRRCRVRSAGSATPCAVPSETCGNTRGTNGVCRETVKVTSLRQQPALLPWDHLLAVTVAHAR